MGIRIVVKVCSLFFGRVMAFLFFLSVFFGAVFLSVPLVEGSSGFEFEEDVFRLIDELEHEQRFGFISRMISRGGSILELYKTVGLWNSGISPDSELPLGVVSVSGGDSFSSIKDAWVFVSSVSPSYVQDGFVFVPDIPVWLQVFYNFNVEKPSDYFSRSYPETDRFGFCKTIYHAPVSKAFVVVGDKVVEVGNGSGSCAVEVDLGSVGFKKDVSDSFIFESSLIVQNSVSADVYEWVLSGINIFDGFEFPVYSCVFKGKKLVGVDSLEVSNVFSYPVKEECSKESVSDILKNADLFSDLSDSGDSSEFYLAFLDIIDAYDSPVLRLRVPDFDESAFDEYVFDFGIVKIKSREAVYDVFSGFPPYNFFYINRSVLSVSEYFSDNAIFSSVSDDELVFFPSEFSISFDEDIPSLLFFSGFGSYSVPIEIRYFNSSFISVEVPMISLKENDEFRVKVNISGNTGIVNVSYCEKTLSAFVENEKDFLFLAEEGCSRVSALYEKDSIVNEADAFVSVKKNYMPFYFIIFSFFLFVVFCKFVFHFYWRRLL